MTDHKEEDHIPFLEKTERFHREYLAEFVEKVAPIYEQHGFSRDAAFLGWLMMKVHDRLDHIEDMLTAELEND